MIANLLAEFLARLLLNVYNEILDKDFFSRLLEKLAGGIDS